MKCAHGACRNEAEPNSNYCEYHAVKSGSKTQLRRDVDVPKGKD